MARRDDEARSPWEADAEDAVHQALENAYFDDVRGVIDLGDAEFDNFDDLHQHLADLYDQAWYGSVPFEGGEAVFRGDSYGCVGDALGDHDVEEFFETVRQPEDTEEIVSSRSLIDDSEQSRVLRVDLEDISEELIQYLARHPERMRSLTPRKFEELVAELFRAKGYTVELTPRSRDGGLDIIAIERSNLGAAMTLIECKRYDPSRPVGVAIVRGLYGVVEDRKATRGLIATTSHFTRGAEAFRDRNQYRMALADFDRMTAFLREWQRRR